MLQRCPATVIIDPPAMGAIALRCAALGWRIRVPLTRLATPVAMMARVEPAVRRGDPVDLVADSDGFSVSVSATAQEDGAPGSRIRVRTDNKSQPIFAEVIDAGRVRLPGFK
jgi:flagella basal body P-ring formation protein FlgA